MKGMRNQVRIQGRLQPGTHGYQALFDEVAIDDGEDFYRDAITGEPLLGPLREAAKRAFEVAEVNACVSRDTVYKDAITGQPLRASLVVAARKLELEYFASKTVWEKRPHS